MAQNDIQDGVYVGKIGTLVLFVSEVQVRTGNILVKVLQKPPFTIRQEVPDGEGSH